MLIALIVSRSTHTLSPVASERDACSARVPLDGGTVTHPPYTAVPVRPAASAPPATAALHLLTQAAEAVKAAANVAKVASSPSSAAAQAAASPRAAHTTQAPPRDPVSTQTSSLAMRVAGLDEALAQLKAMESPTS